MLLHDYVPYCRNVDRNPFKMSKVEPCSPTPLMELYANRNFNLCKILVTTYCWWCTSWSENVQTWCRNLKQHRTTSEYEANRQPHQRHEHNLAEPSFASFPHHIYAWYTLLQSSLDSIIHMEFVMPEVHHRQPFNIIKALCSSLPI